ncbi:MAG: right-handed parallel beta-helix repeat-containing protein [Pirellulales bacterium]
MYQSLLLMALGVAAQPAASLDLYPNFNTVGVNVHIAAADPEQDATATVQYGPDAEHLAEGFPLSRVDNATGRLSGCLFWCRPGTEHFVRVALHDPTTPALDRIALQGKVITRAEPAFPLPASTLYVSPTGKGFRFTKVKPGGLSDAIARAGESVRIVLLKGRYFAGDLQVTANGTRAQPLIIEGEAGEQVILDGADPNPLTWRRTGVKGLFVGDMAALNPNLVVADGARLYPHQSMDDLVANKIAVGVDLTGAVRFNADLDGFYRNPSGNILLNREWRSPKRLYVKFRDDSDPARKKMIVTKENRGLTIAGRSHVRLRNLEFRHYGRAPGGTALLLADCEDVVVDHCTFGINDIGLMLAGNCREVTIQDCEFFDAMAGWHAWKVKASYDDFAPYSNIFPFYSRMLERGGVLYQHGFQGRGIVVRRCQFHDFAQAGHLGPPSWNDGHLDSYEIDFHDNRVWNCAEDGFELDGDSRNVRIWGNEFHHCNASLSLAVAQGGPVYVLCNVFHSIVTDTFTIRPEDGLKTQPGHPFKFQTGDTASRVGDLFFMHNTIDAPGGAVGLDLVAPARWKRFFARNNLIVSDQSHALVVESFDAFPTDLDYNGYFTTGGGSLAKIDTNTRDDLPPIDAKTMAEIRELGWEQHGQFADPQFVDRAGHSYGLRASSPAIDRGEILPGINGSRFSGKAPDLGAFEFK